MTRSDAYLVHLALVIAAAALIWRTRDAGRLASCAAVARHGWPGRDRQLCRVELGPRHTLATSTRRGFPAGRLVLSAPERLYLRHRHPLFREPPDRCGAVLPAVRAVSDPGPGCVHDGRRRRRLRNRLVLLRTAGVSGWRANALAAVLFLERALVLQRAAGNLSHLLLLPLVLAPGHS